MMRLLSSWRARRRPRGLILLYHRVVPEDLDPQLLAVRPERFDAQLSALARIGTAMPLVTLVEKAQSGSLPRRAFAVTFDDGYADNLRFGKPVLERHRMPATVFACSGAVRDQTEYWWDTLERAILRESGPARVQLDVLGGPGSWTLDGAPLEHPEWNVLSPSDPTKRHTAYRELMALVRALSPAERECALADLLRQLGLSAAPRADQRPLSVVELRELAADGLVEIGAHTVSHAQLSKLPAQEQAEQVMRSKVELEQILGRSISSFAYPYGSRDDYTDESVAAVERAGFSLACSNFPGLVERGTDRLQLPRTIVRDVTADALERDITRAFGEE